MIVGEQTAAIKQWFAAHIPAYPEIQARAHEELDRVVGRDRLPVPEDEKNLPYIRAIVKVFSYLTQRRMNGQNAHGYTQEVERVHNPFWLGTPHLSTEDFTYHGYLIPKNTVVIGNTVSQS